MRISRITSRRLLHIVRLAEVVDARTLRPFPRRGPEQAIERNTTLVKTHAKSMYDPDRHQRAKRTRELAVQVLTPRLSLPEFLAAIPRASERVLMLDYDGTLAPFQVRPERAMPYPGIAEALKELIDDGATRVVIVSGRRAEEIVPLLGLARHPEIWGGHGWERLTPDGRLQAHAPSERLRSALEDATQSVAALSRLGARLEHKPASVALHWRGLPALAVARIESQARDAWSRRAGDELDLLTFDGGLELRAKGCNKQQAPFRDDLPSHDLTGGGYWIPDVLEYEHIDEWI